MLNRHRFDWVVDPKLPQPARVWNTRIYESELFSILPSLGSLVSGWVLVVPRRPVLNLRELSANERIELDDIVQKLTKELVSSTRDRVFRFEHGSIRRGSPMGCGLDQAHLHVVPLPFDLLKAAEHTSGPYLDWTSVTSECDPWQCVPENHDYLIAGDQSGQVIFTCPQVPVSQWFRKIIANRLGMRDQWDYREYSGLPNIVATLKIFENTRLPTMVR